MLFNQDMWFWKQQLRHHHLICHPLLFLLYWCLFCFTPWKQQPLLQIAYFNFNYFLVFNYTNCTLKYARFNDSVRSDAALRIIAQADTYIFISHLLTNANNGHWILALSTYCHRVNRSRVCMSKQDKHGIQNTRVYMGKQNIAEYNRVFNSTRYTWVNRRFNNYSTSARMQWDGCRQPGA